MACLIARRRSESSWALSPSTFWRTLSRTGAELGAGRAVIVNSLPLLADRAQPERGRDVDVCRRVGPGQNPSVEQNRARPPPRMRWRGPCLAARCEVGQFPGFPCSAGPPASTAHPCGIPVSRPSHVPGVASRWCPFLTVRVFLLPRRVPRKGFATKLLPVSCYPHSVHRMQVVIRSWRRLSTGLFTTLPQVTAGDPENTSAAVALCNRDVFSQRLPGGQRLVPAIVRRAARPATSGQRPAHR